MTATDKLIELTRTMTHEQGMEVLFCMFDYINEVHACSKEERKAIQDKVEAAQGLMLGTPVAEIRSTTRNHIAHPSVEGC
jgi:flavorubredoxin